MRTNLPLWALVLLSSCASAGPNGRAVLEKRVWEWPDLYFETSLASGRDFCGGELYERRQREFYRTYGKRVRAVLDRHTERYGRQETIVAGACRIVHQPEAEERQHTEAMARFAKWLERAEKDLGIR